MWYSAREAFVKEKENPVELSDIKKKIDRVQFSKLMIQQLPWIDLICSLVVGSILLINSLQQ